MSESQVTEKALIPAPAVLVDARGLACPMPLLKAKLALNACSPGESVRVLATDAGSWRDFPVFASLAGHRLSVCERHAEYFEYCLEKKSPAPK